VRDDATTRGYASKMTRKGAQFRTLPSPFRRMVIIDRRQAFISEYMVPDAAPHAARHVKDRGIVAFIVEVFEDAWRRADVWEGEGRLREPAAKDLRSGVRTNRRQREILRDTALGIPQNRTAKRLGVSLRTLTKELGELRELWGVTSLPELTYRWALSPDRLIDDDRDDTAVDAA
jgi:DNA-binding NarL/FixJ family response regulator